MSTRNFCISLFMLATLGASAQNMSTPKSEPPFHGTIFLDPNIITADDPHCYSSLSPEGQGMRTMFDRRVNNWTTVNAFLFTATFCDDLQAEIQVNAEFGSYELAETQAIKYASVISQLPTCLRKDVKTVSIHKGTQLFGGGNNNLLIHTGQAEVYERDGILEEALVHEATHTSLDARYALDINWLRAQQHDGSFISKYAQENPKREDVSETFLLYMAITLRPERITDELRQTILNAIPNRIYFLQSQDFDFYPMTPAKEQLADTPPEKEVADLVLQSIDKPELHWIAFEGVVSENTVSGGHENGNDLPVCRGSYQGAMHPGKLLANKCNIGWGGKEIELESFEVLINNGVPLNWKHYTGSLPSGAIEAGNENGRILYVGQFTRPDGSVHAGKVFGADGQYIFNYGYGGLEITEKSNFRILVK